MTADTDTQQDNNTAPQDTGQAETADQATQQQDATQQQENTGTSTEKDDDGKGGKAAILADLAKERDTRQATEAKLDAVLTALGLKEDAKDDPEAAAKAATADAQQARAELAVYRAAGKAGADPDALLDSASFLRTLEGIDPADGDKITAAITEAIEKNPRYAASKPAPSAARDATAKSDHTTGASPDDWIRAAVRGRS